MKNEARTPEECVKQLRELVKSGLGLCLDEVLGRFQLTVYPMGKERHHIHRHYDATSLEAVVDKCYEQEIVGLQEFWPHR